MEFHITRFGPNEHWPKGGWSIYRITGEEIASRVKFDGTGKVTERHAWSGYLGTFVTLEEVAAVLDDQQTL